MTRLGTITILNDNRLSRQKASALTRVLNTIRQFAEVRLIDGNLNEEELIAQLDERRDSLVLVPWYRYLAWSKAEAFYGLTRNSGPTIAGYHFGGVTVQDIGGPDHLRSILIDFSGGTNADVARIVRNLLVDTKRSGILPMLDGAGSAVYFEEWADQQGLGQRIDAIFNIPEIGKTDWMSRSGAIRIAIGALWSLVYEEGPGKSGFAQALTSNRPKACFQIGTSIHTLAFRLIYEMPTWSPKDALTSFWPSSERHSSPAELLRRYCDLLRVHRIADTPDVEVVVAFFKPAPANRAPDQIQTLWIEPLSARVFEEPPYEKPSPDKPYLKPLETLIPPRPDEAFLAGREKALADMNVQIRELRRALHERDTRIEELRHGGVGSTNPTPPPDADSLLEAFLEHFYSSRVKSQDLQEKLIQLSSCGYHPQKAADLAALERQIQSLLAQQEEWARKIADVLRKYAEDRKRLKRTG